MAELTPFTIDVRDDVITDLRDRLHRTRWPDQIDEAAWEYGTDRTALQRLCTYWADEFDWPAAQARLNRWPQFTTTIDGQNVHFLHARSPHAGALPLVITHGWPGSIAEFEKIIGPLTDPVAHGGDAADAFHVVCPSMPGYGFSGPTHERGWTIQRVAATVAALMAALGYDHYGAQGGDWGAVVTTHLGSQDASHVVGIHLNMVVAGPPQGTDDVMAGVLPEEMAGIAHMADFREHETGYQAIQGTRPQTLAYGLTDSPAGLAGWILEKFRQWGDCGGDPFNAFTLDELCTNLMIYWATGTINSSMRLYYETMGPGRRKPAPPVPVPTGAAIFPKELYQPPRVWADRQYNITRWTRFEKGGHFAALEQPAALVDDVRAFFRTVR